MEKCLKGGELGKSQSPRLQTTALRAVGVHAAMPKQGAEDRASVRARSARRGWSLPQERKEKEKEKEKQAEGEVQLPPGYEGVFGGIHGKL